MKSAVKISSIYLMVGFGWVLFSDQMIHGIFSDLDRLSLLQTIKGAIYVLFTTVLIFFMVQLLTKRHQEEMANRVRNENKLVQVIEENKQFRHLFEQASLGMVITDPKQQDNPIIYINEGFEKITGYKRKEIIGKNCRFLQGADTTEENKKKIRNAIDTAQPIQIELKNYRKDGTFFWNELKITPIFDDNQQLLCFIGIQEDITEKKTQTIFMENQLDIARKMLSSNDFSTTINQSCQVIEDHLEMGCVILRFDEQHHNYQFFGSSMIPKEIKDQLSGKQFNQRSKEYMRTFLNNANSLVELRRQDEVFGVYWDIMYEAGFKQYWARPIINEDAQILGTFFVFYRMDHHLDSIRLQTLESYSYILSLSLKSMQYMDDIKQNERRYRLIANHATDMVCVVDDQLNTEYISPSHEKLLGEGCNFQTILNSFTINSKDKVEGLINQLRNGLDFERMEATLIDLQQNKHHIELDGKRYYDDQEQKFKMLLVARDVTERKEFEWSLNKVLYYDGLTQLPNRHYFKQLLEKTLLRKHQTALFILDFDQMKEIRNMYGQGAAEYVLIQVIDKLKQVLPRAVIARTGEDEFSVLLKQIDSFRDLEEKVKNVLQVLDTSWHYQTYEFIATVSIGVSLFEEQTADTMILQAELALKEARKKGKHRYYIYLEETQQGTISSLSLQNDLYHALTKQQFEVWYQPQINTLNNSIDGVEALIRWKHDKLGMIAPGQFIPIAEETRWIVPIGTWVLHEVCKDVVTWMKKGNTVQASVNISYGQMEEDKFIQKVKEILVETGCPPTQLIFEITESMIMKDLALSLHVLNELKTLGIKISVDDFGVGYSSLSYLKQFPLDCLKIDRAFVTNIHNDPNDFAIVQAIMEMSKALGLEVIAEGVETVEHVYLLQKLGCQHFQGFWFAKPTKKENIQEVIDTIYQEKFSVQ